ncbi:hypothetical protein AYJ54_24030 [Bradyrhizobium centrolobii]|uniref:Uncharacterized protein n=2 Tax=Bradyrhizobium TaxID=374 RepID=A0A176YYP3_9BRAD|nr:hypothetical protein AYJ54_24030 [Bradyrhizobium centrolobii]OAF11894.1 hypothetical protein AXW67_21635 [Bradyrhizobium neotropicale]
MSAALYNAQTNYTDYKGQAVELKYIYMSKVDATNSVSDGRLSGTYTSSSRSPHAAPSNLGPWFIAVDSTANLTGQIEVVAWGRAIRG